VQSHNKLIGTARQRQHDFGGGGCRRQHCAPAVPEFYREQRIDVFSVLAKLKDDWWQIKNGRHQCGWLAAKTSAGYRCLVSGIDDFRPGPRANHKDAVACPIKLPS